MRGNFSILRSLIFHNLPRLPGLKRVRAHKLTFFLLTGRKFKFSVFSRKTCALKSYTGKKRNFGVSTISGLALILIAACNIFLGLVCI